MSRDVITVGSTMRIPLLYRGEYSQWRERFMNYLEEQIDGGAMINSIQNGYQPLPVIAQVSLAENAQNAPPTLKDPNNETAKDLWDALERQMGGFEYGEQDTKVAILYEYETFKAIEGEQLLDTYLRYLQVINDLKKCGYKKDNCELNYKFLNNMQPEWKQYGDVNDALGYKKKVVVVTSDPLALVAEKTKVSKSKKKVVVSSDSEVCQQETRFVKSDDKKEDNKADEKKRDMSKVKCYNCKKEGYFANDCKKAKGKDYNYYKTKMLQAKKDSDEQVLLAEDQAWMESSSDSDQEINANMVFMAQIEKEGHFAKDCKKAKVKDYNYYKTKMLLAKKDSNEQVLLAEDQAWMESSSDSDQEINANMVFMAQIKKVLSELDESSSSVEETIYEVAYYTSESESESEFETSEYYDNSTNYGLFVNADDDQEIFHDAIEAASENFIKNHIYSKKRL
nr:hypothetical protein [Tanacetum cinerariifolium]